LLISFPISLFTSHAPLSPYFPIHLSLLFLTHRSLFGHEHFDRELNAERLTAEWLLSTLVNNHPALIP
jgi:hypothetical protein